MSRFADEKIQLSKKGDPVLSSGDTEQLLPRIPEWSIVNDNGVSKLSRTYRSKDYPFLVALAAKFGEMAEQANHHPVLLLEWGKLTVTWWTHVIGGLHRNDFIMAARCDRAAILVHGP